MLDKLCNCIKIFFIFISNSIIISSIEINLVIIYCYDFEGNIIYKRKDLREKILNIIEVFFKYFIIYFCIIWLREYKVKNCR